MAGKDYTVHSALNRLLENKDYLLLSMPCDPPYLASDDSEDHVGALTATATDAVKHQTLSSDV